MEKFAPWVRKIHFVTWGHIPKWMNIYHPKLHIVKHSDFMPEKYLPTFSCNPLEINLHRIDGLSERFVYFNDDTFLISETKCTDFFKNEKPCDSVALNVHCFDMNRDFNYAAFQAIGIVNKYFDFHKIIKKEWKKWFHPLNGKYILRTIYLLPCPRFPGIYQPHLPNSFLKSTFTELWEKEYELLDDTSSHKFRNKLDYTQWIFRNWQLVSGNFENRTSKLGKSFSIEKDKDSIESVCKFIRRQRCKMIAINDGEMNEQEFEQNKRMIIRAFNNILPEKSSFEID